MRIICDTREKTPWQFTSSQIKSVEVKKLDTGDYTLENFEDLLCIERKKSVSEISSNIIEKRFENELVRMSEFPHKFMILEFSFEDVLNFPRGSGIPPKKWRYVKIKPQFIVKKLAEYIIKYNISIIYAGSVDNAIYIATSIMKEVHKKYGSDKMGSS